jgi:hypothetical protein
MSSLAVSDNASGTTAASLRSEADAAKAAAAAGPIGRRYLLAGAEHDVGCGAKARAASGLLTTTALMERNASRLLLLVLPAGGRGRRRRRPRRSAGGTLAFAMLVCVIVVEECAIQRDNAITRCADFCWGGGEVIEVMKTTPLGRSVLCHFTPQTCIFYYYRYKPPIPC